jgi:hypothetical protein
MPKALGQFGKAKNSDIIHKVYVLICSQDKVWKIPEIWKHIHSDLDKISQLSDILSNLVEAGKIQVVKQAGGFLPKRAIIENIHTDLVNYDLLSAEERAMKL